ncbi:MAG: TIR domain-containing protein [Methylococcaceae bacterium]|nr:MAG: TIR domain-containing protein [Methylococcaceae bacterium]
MGGAAFPIGAGERGRRFRVALSFPGEHRAYVAQIADCLAQQLGRRQVFYDRWYEVELAKPNLDLHLQAIYHDQADLVVVFLCKEYNQKQWCGLEWRALRDLIKRREDALLLPIRLDDADIPGLLSIDGYVDAQGRPAEEIAALILQRLGMARPFDPPRRAWRKWLAAALLLAGLGLASWLFYVQPRQEEIARHLDLARRYMDTGQYREAQDEYAQAEHLAAPFDGGAARLGREKAAIGARWPLADAGEREALARRLDALLEQRGEDADVLLLDGDRHYWSGLDDGKSRALPRYRQALERRQQLAEAAYRLGVLFDEAGDGRAPDYFEAAYRQSPQTPHYAVDYAATLLKQGRYRAAIDALAPVADYPLARLEQAKGHWALGEFAQAEVLQAEAVNDLANPASAANPRLRYSWKLDLPDAGRVLQLSTDGGKRCYAGLALAASRFFQGREQAAQQAAGQAGCPADSAAVRDALALDLRCYASAGLANGPERLRKFLPLLGAPSATER